MKLMLSAAMLLLLGRDLAGATPYKRAPAAQSADGWLGFGFAVHGDTHHAGRRWLHVVRVVAGSPSERAGLRPQDVIVAIDGHQITFADDKAALDYFVAIHRGQTVTFQVARPTGTIALRIKAAARPAGQTEEWRANYERARSHERTGSVERRPR